MGRLEQLDARLRAKNPAEPTTDKRGMTFHEDVRANVLLPPAKAEIEHLRGLAGHQLNKGQLDAADATLKSLILAINRETLIHNAISDYWGSGAKNPPDRSAYVAYLRKNGIEPRFVKEIEQAQRQLDADVEAARFTLAVKQDFRALVEWIDRASTEEVQAIRQSMGTGAFSPFLAVDNPGGCRELADKTSGSSVPKFRSSGTPGKDYYPAHSRRLTEEGNVYVMVRVSKDGCPMRAMVTVSSGYPRLDSAAMEMMLDARFLPAEREGHAVEADFWTLTKWELKGSGD